MARQKGRMTLSGEKTEGGENGLGASLMALAASAWMLQASVAGAAAAAEPPLVYPVKFAGGFQVGRGADDARNYCTNYGFRAVGPQSPKDGPLTLLTEKWFDESGSSFVRGAFAIDLEKSAYTDTVGEVNVEIDLDGKTHSIPSADIKVAIVTFLNARFPAELLNAIAAAQEMKVYVVDSKTKARTLFATANMAAGRAAFPAFVKCTVTLPEFPSRLAGNWNIKHEGETCTATASVREFAKNLRYGIAAFARSAKKKGDEPAALFFTESKFSDPLRITKPAIKLAGSSYKTTYSFKETDLYEHWFLIPEAALDKFGPGATLSIEDDGKPVIGGPDLIPPYVVQALKQCAATS
jgi:hypothetical protein